MRFWSAIALGGCDGNWRELDILRSTPRTESSPNPRPRRALPIRVTTATRPVILTNIFNSHSITTREPPGTPLAATSHRKITKSYYRSKILCRNIFSNWGGFGVNFAKTGVTLLIRIAYIRFFIFIFKFKNVCEYSNSVAQDWCGQMGVGGL